MFVSAAKTLQDSDIARVLIIFSGSVIPMPNWKFESGSI